MELFRKAHYDLDIVKSLLSKPDTRHITRRSKTEAYSLGYVTVDEMVERVCSLKRSEIEKTMTADADSTLWQDVYKTYDDDVLLYIKLQINHDDNGVIISFHKA